MRNCNQNGKTKCEIIIIPNQIPPHTSDGHTNCSNDNYHWVVLLEPREDNGTDNQIKYIECIGK